MHHQIGALLLINNARSNVLYSTYMYLRIRRYPYSLYTPIHW